MQYKDGKMTDIKIAYIGGGSRAWAWIFMTDLAMEKDMSGEIRLYDLDVQAAENNRVIGSRLSAREEVPGKWRYCVCADLAETLDGADFVVISILPGTLDEMESDVHLPERLGIYQSVGDTAGPGGAVRALRAVPVFAEFARAVKKYAPQAWVINYTNPMAVCMRALYEAFPSIKAFGCCHEVFNTQTLLANLCREVYGLTGVDRRDIMVNVLGINHFTWFDSASLKGLDLFPMYRNYIDAHFEEGFNDSEKPWRESTFFCAHRVKFDLFRRYGLIAAAGDRHLAEFMPGDEYLKDPETVRSWKFSLTPVSWRKKNRERCLEHSARLVSGREEIPLQTTGEEGVLLLRALCGMDRVISNVNLPNSARQIRNLPAEMVVETNAVFSRDAIRPVSAGSLPEGVLELTRPHTDNQTRLLRAALDCDREMLYEVFLTDPLVRGRATESQIKKLADDMVANTAACLPDGWK